jgi:hypothetical protein
MQRSMRACLRLYALGQEDGHELGWVRLELNRLLNETTSLQELTYDSVRAMIQRMAGDLAPFALLLWKAVKQFGSASQEPVKAYRGVRMHPEALHFYRSHLGRAIMLPAFTRFRLRPSEVSSAPTSGCSEGLPSGQVYVGMELLTYGRQIMRADGDGASGGEEGDGEILLPPGSVVVVSGVAVSDGVIQLTDIGVPGQAEVRRASSLAASFGEEFELTYFIEDEAKVGKKMVRRGQTLRDVIRSLRLGDEHEVVREGLVLDKGGEIGQVIDREAVVTLR